MATNLRDGAGDAICFEVEHARLIDDPEYQRVFRNWQALRGMAIEAQRGRLTPEQDHPLIVLHLDNYACCEAEPFLDTYQRVVVDPLRNEDLTFRSKPKGPGLG